MSFAKNLADRIKNCELIVVYVIEWSPFSFQTAEENAQRHKRREEEIAIALERVLNPAAKTLTNAGLTARAVVRHGNVADTNRSRYTHRVAISNSRMIGADPNIVAFTWKNYRVKSGDRWSAMRLATDEFICRFLIHVLREGFHRIRHFGLLASSKRKVNIAKVRALLSAKHPKQEDKSAAEVIPLTLREPCPDCGGAMRIIETFRRGAIP